MIKQDGSYPDIDEDYIWDEPVIHILPKITIKNNLEKKGYYEFIIDKYNKLVMIQKNNASIIAVKNGLIDMFKILCAEQIDKEYSEISVPFSEQDSTTDWLSKLCISGHTLSSIVKHNVYQDILKYLINHRRRLASFC
jgi:hypothetical protein